MESYRFHQNRVKSRDYIPNPRGEAASHYWQIPDKRPLSEVSTTFERTIEAGMTRRNEKREKRFSPRKLINSRPPFASLWSRLVDIKDYVLSSQFPHLSITYFSHFSNQSHPSAETNARNESRRVISLERAFNVLPPSKNIIGRGGGETEKLTIPARNFLCAADARRTGKATNIKAGGCGRFSFRPASTNSRHGFATERSRDAGSIRQRRSA